MNDMYGRNECSVGRNAFMNVLKNLEVDGQMDDGKVAWIVSVAEGWLEVVCRVCCK